MRPTRPTLNVLKSLPRDPAIESVLEVIKRAKVADEESAVQILQEARLEEISNKLLEDADRGFANGGTPTKHEEASESYHATVYEVRDTTGAGWRGAVILDKDSNPWLIFADRHNQFHAKVANLLRRDKHEFKTKGETKGPAKVYEPRPLDYDMRDREDERLSDLAYKRDLISGVIEALREANSKSAVSEGLTPIYSDDELGKPIKYTIEIDHDEPAEIVEEANLSTSNVTITVAMSLNAYIGSQLLIACGALYIQPDTNYHESVYTKDNQLRLDLCITHAKLAQILGQTEISESNFPPSPLPPDQLHWVPSPDQIESAVTGKAVQSLCGNWFVPVENERADLPVCVICESIIPLAQEMLDQLRLKAQN